MASSIMSIGHSPRRRPSFDLVSTPERVIAAGVLVTLAVNVALLFFYGRSSDEAATIDVLADAPASADLAPASAAEGSTFVESGDSVAAAEATPSNGTDETIAAETIAIEAGTMLGGFEIAAGDIRSLYVTVGREPVNMRVRPGVTASIAGQIEPGDASMALSTGRIATDGNDEWVELEYLGTTGWVRSDLVQRGDAN